MSILNAAGWFVLFLLLAGTFLFRPDSAQAQQADAFTEAEIVKIERVDAATFERRFRNTRWTGQGMQGITDIDRIPSMELRARFQTVFGDPTRTLDDLAFRQGFRMAEAIQYEYWFIVNDTYPMMILDIDGPFARGLVYAVSVSYIDLMPQIKRALSRKLMEPTQLTDFTDVFYSPERGNWYEITFRNGEFNYVEIPRPSRFRGVNFN
ncbi:MAG: hypothetical protein LAT75_04455 [Candidatus Cyclonatronum sp.]|uniref:hypothetical protein n=1 Tax=Cyclonatronum sp. TaxID=3024185 RepID=UPI0025C631E9|nr:hypothetical protein [Cyclonatronum sp.]MCC5934377.1 hypothetical protein [Balneolales bacterium]MCH8486092.1 hypothetical protein [Cyclonatronum sp.]